MQCLLAEHELWM